jgi:hypothetical protein
MAAITRAAIEAGALGLSRPARWCMPLRSAYQFPAPLPVKRNCSVLPAALPEPAEGLWILLLSLKMIISLRLIQRWRWISLARCGRFDRDVDLLRFWRSTRLYSRRRAFTRRCPTHCPTGHRTWRRNVSRRPRTEAWRRRGNDSGRCPLCRHGIWCCLTLWENVASACPGPHRYCSPEIPGSLGAGCCRAEIALSLTLTTQGNKERDLLP